MHKKVMAASISLLVVGMANLWAQGPGTQKGMGRMMMGDSTMAGCGMAMSAMLPKSVAATTDGYVVLAGSRLLQYDKNLKLVKTVEIPMDTTYMKKFMQQMGQACPMMQGQGQQQKPAAPQPGQKQQR
jgi:hypothetical protein